MNMSPDFNNIANLPEGLINGVDVSHYQLKVNWATLKAAGVGFAYIKASEGTTIQDELAATHAANATANGMQIGYYHFAYPKPDGNGSVTGAAQSEAQNALAALAKLPARNMPFALDLEWVGTPLTNNDFLAWVKAFIAAMNCDMMIYGGKPYLDQHLPAAHGLGVYPLWLSRYNNNYNMAICPNGWADWNIWQFSGGGTIAVPTGLTPPATIDLNFMKTGAVPPQPSVTTPAVYKYTTPMMQGNTVRAIQTALITEGYSTGGVDGIFGVNTMNAVIAFQAANGLTADGIVGNITAAALGITL